MDSSAAASLLHWLDANSDIPVMDRVFASLQPEGATGPVPLALEVDLMSLMCDDVELASNVMVNTRIVTAETQTMISQQLAMQAAASAGTQQDPDPDASPPSIRLSLKFTDAPLPLSTPEEVRQQALSANSCPTAPSQGLLVSCMGVVVGLAPPVERTYSCRIMCPACGAAVDVLADDGWLPCCNLPRTAMMQEDLTGRVMMATQQLWVSGLSSSTGMSSYGCSSAPVLIHLPEHQVANCSLGGVAHIIGHAKTHMTTAAAAPVTAGQGCSIQITASNIQPVLPHMLWTLQPSLATPSSISSGDQHLQHLWELLSTALGCQAPIDPHVALSLMLSAVAVGGRDKQQPGTAEQVNVLFLHDGFAPSSLRMLQAAAALLSPQSVFMPVQQAEHVNPITKEGPAGGAVEDPSARPVYASILHLANTGVAVADLCSLPTKTKQQLLTALQQRATAPHKDIAPNMHPPMTATCWGSAAWQDVSPATGDEFAIKPAKQSAAAAKITYNGFDLCIGDTTCHEDELFWTLDMSQATPQQQQQLQQSEQQAADRLRQLVAAAALSKPPVLSGAAQTFLGQYFLVLRQSLESSNKASKPMLLASLVRVATAVARLHQRSVVVEQPDAAVAVLLMEQTLSIKLGDAYRSLLELPADLLPTSGRTLDDQIALLHGIMSRTFRQYCCTEDEYMADADNDSGCSGGPGGFGLPDSQVEVGF